MRKNLRRHPKIALLCAAVALVSTNCPTGASASTTELSCPQPVPYPSDSIVRLTLKIGGDPGPLKPEYQRFISAQARNLQHDPANLCRFKDENIAQLRKAKPNVVLIGDSITESWLSGSPELRELGYVSRGISSQTTVEVKTRFQQDVVALHPKVVHILIGTNNVAGIGRPFDNSAFKNDILGMIRLAKANGIAVILGSILPVEQYPWRPAVRPKPIIKELNSWIQNIASQKDVAFVNYYEALVSPTGGMRSGTTNDGVHPNLIGYKIMSHLLLAAVADARRRGRATPD